MIWLILNNKVKTPALICLQVTRIKCKLRNVGCTKCLWNFACIYEQEVLQQSVCTINVLVGRFEIL